MFNWKDRVYVNARKKVFKNLETNEMLNLEIQDDEGNILEESETPLTAYCLNQAQQELVDDMSKTYIGTSIEADTIAGVGRINKLYGKTTEVGTGEKSPTNPYELEAVGDDVNLFNLETKTVTANGITFIIKTDGSVIANGTATATAYVAFKELNIPTNVTYTLSGCPAGGGDNSYKIYGMRTSDYGSAGDDTGGGSTFTLSQNAIVEFRVRIASGYTANNLVFKPKLIKGSVATPWSPYGYGTVEIISKNGSNTSSNIVYVNKPLCSIKNNEDNIIAQDYIDYTNKKVYRECEYIVLSGNDNWSMLTEASYNNRKYFFSNDAKIVNIAKRNSYPFSNIAKMPNILTDLNDKTKDYVTIANNGCLCFWTEKYSTIEAFKAVLNTQPLEIILKRSTPIIEDIDCSNKITQYDGQTTVYNRDGAEMEVSLTNNKAISEVNEDLDNVEKDIKEVDYSKQIIMTNSNYVFDGFLKKLGKLVVLQGKLTKSFFAKNALETCMQIPDEIAPQNTVSNGVLLSDMGAMAQESNIYKKGIVSVNTSGNVSILNEDNGMKLAMICISWYKAGK